MQVEELREVGWVGRKEGQERLNPAALPTPWSGGYRNFKSENLASNLGSAHIRSQKENTSYPAAHPPSDLRPGI